MSSSIQKVYIFVLQGVEGSDVGSCLRGCLWLIAGASLSRTRGANCVNGIWETRPVDWPGTSSPRREGAFEILIPRPNGASHTYREPTGMQRVFYVYKLRSCHLWHQRFAAFSCSESHELQWRRGHAQNQLCETTPWVQNLSQGTELWPFWVIFMLGGGINLTCPLHVTISIW